MKKYVFVKQLDTYDCAPACMAMILKYKYNLEFTIGELRSIFNADSNGCTYIGIKTGLNKLNIKSEVFQCERDLKVFDEVQYPFLTQIMVGNQKHFIVIYEKKKNKLTIGDPSKNSISSIKIEKIFEIWIPFILQINDANIDEKLIQNCKKKKNNLYKELWSVKYSILFYWVLSIAIYILGIFFAGMYSSYFDIVIPNKFTSIIINFTVLYLIALLIQLVLKYINSRIDIKINNKIDKMLITKLANEFFSKDFSILEYYQSGELITRFNNINQIRRRMLYLVQSFPLDIFIIITTMVLLFKRNVSLSLLIFVPMIVFGLIIYLSQDYLRNLSYKLFEESENLNVELIESINNIETLKNYSVTNNAEKKIHFKLDKLLKTSEKFFSFDILQVNIKNTIIAIFNVLILGLGAYLIINDNIASGTLLTFNTLAMNVFNPFLNITTIQATLEQGKVAKLRYEDLIDTKIIREEGEECVLRIENLAIKNLYFSYNGYKNTLVNISLELFENENVAIIGNSGSGKSTLAKLIGNYYDVIEGEIKINGISYSKLNHKKLREKILYSPQTIEVFSDTILNNITLERKIELKNILNIAEKIGFDTVINSLEDGLDTIIGADGTNLSMGQLQLLNIIRATAINHELIIFDEVTNGLDIILRNKVKNYLMNYGNIKIFITHDTDLALACDKIYVIKDGVISKDLKDYIKSEKELIELLN